MGKPVKKFGLLQMAAALFVSLNVAHAEDFDWLREEVIAGGGEVFVCTLTQRCEAGNCAKPAYPVEIMLVDALSLNGTDNDLTRPAVSEGHWIATDERSKVTAIWTGEILTFILPSFGQSVGLATLDIASGKIALSKHGTKTFGQMELTGACEGQI